MRVTNVLQIDAVVLNPVVEVQRLLRHRNTDEHEREKDDQDDDRAVLSSAASVLRPSEPSLRAGAAAGRR